jgi:hypothetical protein
VDGVLRLKHGASPIYAFIEELTTTKQFVLDVKNTYNPLTVGDVGGIIVYGSDTDYISLDEYYDVDKGTVQTYPWLRLVRNYNTYQGYWSNDGETWTLIGSQEFDNVSPKIGLFLSGDTGENFDAEEIRIMAGTKLVLDNISPGQRVDLLDGSNIILDTQYGRTGSSTVQFDVSKYTIPLEARFVVAGTVGLNVPTTFNMWGGDTYAVNYLLDLSYIDNDGVRIPLEDSFEEFLGYLNIGMDPSKSVKMVARNDFDNGTFTGITIHSEDYKSTGQYNRLVKLAPDNAGVPGVLQDSITLPDINAGMEQEFWLVLYRETDPAKVASEVYFGLNVTAIFN